MFWWEVFLVRLFQSQVIKKVLKTQEEIFFLKFVEQLQNYLNPGAEETATPPAGAEPSSPTKTDFTLETATTGNQSTVSKFDDLFNE